MKVSLLNERIQLLCLTVTKDDIGNHISEWQEVFSCYATISSEAPKETIGTAVIWDSSKIDFTIRYSSEVATIQSTQYRVFFKGDMYEVVGVDHMNYKHQCLKLHCQKVMR